MRLLASADALLSLSGHRRQQVWVASALRSTPVLLKDAPVDEGMLELPPAPEGEEIVFDYAPTGLTLRRHPLALLRPLLAKRRLAGLRRRSAGRRQRRLGQPLRPGPGDAAPAAGHRQGRDLRVAGG
jgi:hypothetical protein